MTKTMTLTTKTLPKKRAVKLKKGHWRVTPVRMRLMHEYWQFKENFNVAVVAAGAVFKGSYSRHEELAAKIIELALYIEANMSQVLNAKRRESKLPDRS